MPITIHCSLLEKKPQEGDVFVLQPIKDTFYFGKAIQTNLKSVDSFINGMTLIYIYRYCSINKEIPPGLENEEFLIAPIIVNNQPWQKGYFETIGNIEVSENEKTADFAFWDVLKEEYVDMNGQVIKNKPEYFIDISELTLHPIFLEPKVIFFK